MPLTAINHYLIRSEDLEQSRAFYEDVLGMSQIPRPDFPFPGYWLGVSGAAQVHLAPGGIENAPLYFLGSPPGVATQHSGVIDHVAFLASEPKNFVEHLKEKGVAFRPRYLADSNLFQLFVQDPDGVTVEINFFDVDSTADWGGEDYKALPKVS
ncbi:MAG: VOC family protein [Burkholderiaceae bacterium]|jgi:catechol 2,3-dioxygenase-like lactoylglutathione lyase family enzyme